MSAARATVPDTRLRGLLRQVWPQHTAKHAASAAGVSHRTAEAWTRGVSSPSAEILLRMAARSDALAEALEARIAAVRFDRARARAARAGEAVAMDGEKG